MKKHRGGGGGGGFPHPRSQKFFHLLLVALLTFSIASISFELPKLFKCRYGQSSTLDITKASIESLDNSNFKAVVDFLQPKDLVTSSSVVQGALRRRLDHVANERVDEHQSRDAPRRPQKKPMRSSRIHRERLSSPEKNEEYGRISNQIREAKAKVRELSGLQRLADDAWAVGAIVWRDLQNNTSSTTINRRPSQACPLSVLKSEGKMQDGVNAILLPCGLMIGSSITIVGKPRSAHLEYLQQIGGDSQGSSVSQFILELQGLILADGEDPPRILHINPRLKGDWSGKPVIELNTCYRGQWGAAQRCDGWDSREDDTVDGLPRCENWIRVEQNFSKETRTKRWLDRLIGYTGKPSTGWKYPFSENQIFVLTVRAGWEGYHISVDGRHVASFPFRTGFILEEATGLSINGDIDLHSVIATSLPLSLSSVSPGSIELYGMWKAPPLPEGPIELFIGILSASNHFAERMALRKTWMQSNLITSSKVVARFFVALHRSNEINTQLLKEAAFYGDVVILPFVDQYELVVLKTVAICEYGVQNMSAKYIMKCDDDTFVRVDAVLYEINAMHREHGLYMGNMNLYHKPLRLGKWAVTYEEWPEEAYPPYANGPGYVITSDIASFIVSQHANRTLRLFKMEDVSMGMWVVQFNSSHYVNYRHSLRFCQFGCIEDYFTAHYQSPRQMLCLWERLLHGKAQCCNMKR